MASKKFTDSYLKGLKPKDDRYEVQDSATTGLRIRISPSGKKSWVYVYRQGGKLRRMTIGSYPQITLSQARATATTAYVAREEGEDPARATSEARESHRKAPTVEQMVHAYIERYSKLNKRTWQDDQRMLMKDVVPQIGHRRARDIHRREIVALYEKLSSRAPVAASRTFEVIRKMWNWAIDVELDPKMETSPCDRIKGLRKAKPRKRVLNTDEAKALWQATHTDKSALEEHIEPDVKKFWPSIAVRLALQLLLLTGQRRAEVAQASVSEFDLNKGLWTIPADRTKKGRISKRDVPDHVVPLTFTTRLIVKELIDLGGGSTWLLPSPRNDGPIDPDSLSKAQKRIRTYLIESGSNEAPLTDWRTHDLRRTVATGLARLKIPRIVIAALLNHTSETRDITAMHYVHHDYTAEILEALEKWEEYLKQERVIS